MKSNNITTDRTLNALRRHLSRTFLLLSLLTLCVGQMWATKTIYYANPNDWNPPYCYAWGTGNNGWPGKAMTATDHKKDGHTIYKIDLSDSYTKCIFSNNGANQTGDITFTAGKVTSDGSSWYTYNASYWDAEYGEKNIYLDISNNTGWKVANGYVGFHLYWDKAASDGQHKERLDATLVEGNIYVVTYSRFNSPFIRGWKAARWSTGGGDDWNTSNGIATSSTSTNNKLSVPSGGWSGCTLTWGTYVPTVSSVALSYSVVPTSGSGTSVDPYIVATGTSVTVTATPTSVIDDSQCTMKYSWDSGSYGTTATKTLNCSTNNTTYSTTVTCQNYISSTGGNTASATVYFKAVSTPTIGLTAPSSGVRGESVTLTATTSNASTPTIVYQYSTSNTFASNVTDIASTTSTSQSWNIPAGTSGTTYYLRAKMTVSGTNYYSSILTLTAYGKKTIHVKNTNNWTNVYLYTFSSETNGSFPGKTGSSYGAVNTGGQWWDITITTQSTKFILSSGNSSGGPQTADLTSSYYTDGNCYAISSGSGTNLTLTATDCPTAPTSVTTTETPTASTNTGMTIKGSIGGNGNDKITSYGFYYGTTTACSTQVQVGTTDKTGDFTKALTGLTAGTTYYFKAYATNGQGTTYGTRYSYKIPYSVTVSKSTGCESITPSAGSYYYNAGFTVTAVAATGYTFNAWSKTNGNLSSASEPSTGTNTVTFTPTANSATITATYTANTYPITFVNTGTGYASGGPSSTTASYNTAMPAVTAPTASTGYKFMGYFDAAGGKGTQYYTSTGTSAHVWDKTSGATLYAHYEPATITAVTLNHEAFEYESAASGTHDLDYVIISAEPTIAPTGYVTPINITWELQYSNGNDVAGHAVTYLGTNRAEFSIVGLARGTYQLHATVRTGGTRGSGTIISTYDKPFQIASDYNITVNYKCDTGDGLIVIKAPTSITGYALKTTAITAPDITGYAFSKWRAGDGVVIEGADSNGEKASATINFTATFDGSLTAIYTRKRIIYFNNTLGWSSVNVYFYSDAYWDSSKGTGAQTGGSYTGKNGAMTNITGTNIWYYDCDANSVSSSYTTVSFTETGQNGYEFFSYKSGTTTPNNVVYRSDYKSSLPMFVPLSSQTGVLKNSNQAKYYNDGYWMNYPENTGYWLKIWDGSLELYNIPFEFTADKTMPMALDVNLESQHTYEFKIYRADDTWYGNNGTMVNGKSGDVGQTVWEFMTGKNNCGITTSAAGSYTFTLNYGNSASNGLQYLVGVHYPAAAGDFQILYSDTTRWSLGYQHGASWKHPSRMIEHRANGVDTVSFFVAKGKKPALTARKVYSITANTGAITWTSATITSNVNLDAVSESGVYNFKITQNAAGTAIASIENIGAYTGNYYIRCQALANGWGNYRNETDHLMTYTEFSENRSTNTFGELYSHYKAKWCERNTNIKFCIANDYSPCITDTLIQDVPDSFSNTESDGTLKYEKNGDNSMKYDNSGNAYLDIYSANVRFMWNRSTNKISRAYVSAATTAERRFLVLQGSGASNANIYSSAGNNLTANPPGTNSILMTDDQNWIYETTIQANPSALIKLFARYNGVDQYFRGTSAATFTKDVSAIEILGGDPSSTKYSVRVIYDFKTNRLVCAWIPTGHSQEITGDVVVNADVMFIREHQEEAQCITFANDNSKLSEVKTVYGSMKFNRWILGNRQNPTDTDIDLCDTEEHISTYHPPLAIGNQLSQYERALYFISFPFDVKVSEIFGFGQYGVHWVIEYYDGLTRAQNGYWIDSKPNWKYVDPDMAQTYVLEKGVGYILCLNLSKMAYDDFDFWSNKISYVELFFPSQSTISEITAVNETIPALPDTYRCTINRGTEEGDRRIKDSYWRCIGVPGYSTYNGSLTTNGSAITWKNDDSGEFDISKFPFLYAWNTADNSLTAQATTNYRFKAMHAYLVQNGNQIVWSKASFRNSIVARRQKAEDIINTDWRLTISRDGQMEDQAFVRMSDNEDVTDEFDFGQDLIKELNSSRSNIYSYIGYERCAANCMPINTTSTTTVPLGVKVPEAGDYTIALPDGASGINLTLIDTETGNRTNLSAGLDYTLTLETGDYNDRFFLEIAPIQHIATGIDEINGEANGSTHKVLINGILYIVRDGKVYDARGSRVE